jgi:hypothetical protein
MSYIHIIRLQRRRHKINERFRTLQELVPGCDDKVSTWLLCVNSVLSWRHAWWVLFVGPVCDTVLWRHFQCNQVSTLDHTIQYMKSLQHQVQAMCVSGGGPDRPLAAAVYPVVEAPQHAPHRGAAEVAAPTMMPTAPVVLAAADPTTMVPFRAMVQLPHYPAAAVPAVMMMPAAAPPLYPAAAAAAPVAHAGATRSNASRRQGSSSSRSLRQKQGKWLAAATNSVLPAGRIWSL